VLLAFPKRALGQGTSLRALGLLLLALSIFFFYAGAQYTAFCSLSQTFFFYAGAQHTACCSLSRALSGTGEARVLVTARVAEAGELLLRGRGRGGGGGGGGGGGADDAAHLKPRTHSRTQAGAGEGPRARVSGERERGEGERGGCEGGEPGSRRASLAPRNANDTAQGTPVCTPRALVPKSLQGTPQKTPRAHEVAARYGCPYLTLPCRTLPYLTAFFFQ